MKNQMKRVWVILILAIITLPGYGQYKKAMTSGAVVFNELMHVSVEAYDGKEVVVETGSGYKVPDRAKGLRPINGLGMTDNTGIGLGVKQEGDNLVFYQVARNSDTHYKVKVPRSVKVKYMNSSIHGGDFVAANISNEMEIQTHGGDIHLRDVTGPVVLSSVHGDIDLVYNKVADNLPSSIASVHGDVDVSIPAATRADLSLGTSWGEVYSDMDIQVVSPDGMKVYGSKKIKGQLNGGGVQISISSTHGNVYVRKK